LDTRPHSAPHHSACRSRSTCLLQCSSGNLLERRRIVGWILRDLLQRRFEYVHPYLGVLKRLPQRCSAYLGHPKTKVKAKLKSKKRKKLAQRLDRKNNAKAKVEASAASETSGSVIDEIKVKLKD
jgi:hypothetical protein